jgi:thioredoxin 1
VIEPALDELAGTTGSVEFVKLDIDENPRTATTYGVLSLPTVMLFAGGEPRETVYGARPKKHFEKTFSPYF